MANVWVGNLPAAIAETVLLDLFASFGAINSCKVINRPRGTCGMVLFAEPSSASRAVQQMNNLQYQDKPLIVKLAKDKGLSFTPEGGFKRKFAPETNVWIGNLPPSLSQEDLSAMMSSYGSVMSVKVLNDKRTRQPGGAAMVNFSSPKEAAAAMSSLEGTVMADNGRPIVIRHSQPKVAALAALGRPVRASGTNVWVGNLPKHYGQAEVTEVFSAYGPVTSVKILNNRVTRQPEGSALVNFATPQGANAALEAVSGFALEEGGAPLVLRLATHDVGSRAAMTRAALASADSIAPTLRRSWGAAAGGVPGIPTNLWIGNLPANYGPSEVQGLFQPYGRVTSVKVLVDRSGQSGSKAAMVNYSSAAEAAVAIRKMSGVTVPGSPKPLIVKYSTKDFGASAGPTRGRGASTFRGAPTIRGGSFGATPRPVYSSKGGIVPAAATDNLWVGNLPVNWSDADVKSLFSGYGRVVSVAVFPPKREGQCSGAMVRFGSLSEATGAMQALNGTPLEAGAPALIIRYSAKGSPGAVPVAGAVPRPAYHPYTSRGRGRPY